MSAGGAGSRSAQRREREQRRRRSRTRWIVIAGALVLVLVAGGTATALMLNGQDSSDEAGSATETPVAAEPVVFAEDEPAPPPAPRRARP